MAAVVGAKHVGLDEMVAIKVLLPEYCDDPAIVDRFVQEGKTAIKIRSEHVVRMLDVGVFSGRAYLVMEYLDGEDLDVLLGKTGPLPFATAVDMLLQACEAIGEAHALGVVHRDLKPANLFLTHRADGSPCVKVLDFGISKTPRSAPRVSQVGAVGSSTVPSLMMGSPQYMSPEQMRSATTVDQRSDIWSLGATLYELVTGQMAFEGSSTAEVCARVFQGEPEPIARLRPDVPYDFELVIARCIEKDISRRYTNVAELARALAPFGSSGARVSAESIARVVEGGIEGRHAWTGAGTMRPTAAEILAVPRRPRRVSGYLVASLVLVAAFAVVAASAARRVAPQHWWNAVTAVATAPPPSDTFLSPPAPSASATGRAAPPSTTAFAASARPAVSAPPPPPKPHHAPPHHPAIHVPAPVTSGGDDVPF
jgi:serine/threonine-protein kinase